MNERIDNMIVYTLLGFNDYDGSELVGVFHQLEDLHKCVREGTWYFLSMRYVQSRLGEKINYVEARVEYVSFARPDKRARDTFEAKGEK